MKDPRLTEVEFLAALDKDQSGSVDPSQWAVRLGVTKEFFTAMVFPAKHPGSRSMWGPPSSRVMKTRLG